MIYSDAHYQVSQPHYIKTVATAVSRSAMVRKTVYSKQIKNLVLKKM
jgi:hypothetical protein